MFRILVSFDAICLNTDFLVCCYSTLAKRNFFSLLFGFGLFNWWLPLISPFAVVISAWLWMDLCIIQTHTVSHTFV